MRAGRSIGNGRGWLGTLGSVPAAVLPLLPSFTCPACIAAYAGVLSAMGLGFILSEAVLGPLVLAFLVLSIATVVWSSRSHGRWGPLRVTVLGSALVVLGRLIWDLPLVLYAGVASLLAATLWNLWLKRPRGAGDAGNPSAPSGSDSTSGIASAANSSDTLDARVSL